MVLGGVLAMVRESFVRGAERREAKAAKLEAAMREYLAALDAITVEAENAPIPPKKNRFDRWLERKAQGTTLDFIGTLLARLLHRAVSGQRVVMLGDRLALAAAQLRLIAPESVLAIMQEVEEATKRAGPAGEHWPREWRLIRDDVRTGFRRELGYVETRRRGPRLPRSHTEAGQALEAANQADQRPQGDGQ